MQIFQVGGAVRDALLGRPNADQDWVVVGATPEQMAAQGFRQVGADFPVFLHPESGDEYALARQERKSGAGYHGFSVTTENVSLEDDLRRRDLTINAMALTADGQLIDPFGGRADLEDKVLRHVGPAFAEDPLRILRVFRFKARFGSEWRIHQDTAALLEHMVASGEADHLVPERIWKEVSRALMEPSPSLFVSDLARFGLLHRPPFKSYSVVGAPLSAIDRAAQANASLATRFALAFGSREHGKPHPGIPTEVLKVSAVFSETRGHMQSWIEDPRLHAQAIQGFLQRVGWFKDSSVLSEVLAAWAAMGFAVAELQAAAHRARAVDTSAITAGMPPGPAVGQAISAARECAIQGR